MFWEDLVPLKRAFSAYANMSAGGGSLLVPCSWVVSLGGGCFIDWLELRCVDGPKLTSCDVLGMLVKYGLSTDGGFGGGEKVNPAGVLVSGIGLLSLLVPVPVTGGDMTCCWEEVVFCDACCCAVCWLPCCVSCCPELGTVC